MREFLKLFVASFAAAIAMRMLLNIVFQKSPIFEVSDAVFPVLISVMLAIFIPLSMKSRQQ